MVSLIQYIILPYALYICLLSTKPSSILFRVCMASDGQVSTNVLLSTKSSSLVLCLALKKSSSVSHGFFTWCRTFLFATDSAVTITSYRSSGLAIGVCGVPNTVIDAVNCTHNHSPAWMEVIYKFVVPHRGCWTKSGRG